MICKDSEAHLERTLLSLPLEYFSDKVIVDTGSVDATKEIAKRHGVRVIDYVDPDPIELDGKKFLSDFSVPRNISFEECEADFIFWIDCDDVLSDSQALVRFCEDRLRPSGYGYDFFGVTYDYDHNEYGACISTQVRDRIARKGLFVWKSPIHEVLCSTGPYRGYLVDKSDFFIKHESDGQDRALKGRRNFLVSQNHIEKNKGNVEPRQWLNLGNSLLGAKEYEKAIEAFRKYLRGSTWNTERAMVYLYIAHCQRELEEVESAIENCFRSMRLEPDLREPYIELADCFVRTKEYEKAAIWAERALEAKRDNLEWRGNPYFVKCRPHEILTLAYMNLLDFDKAIENADKFLDHIPGEKFIRGMKAKCMTTKVERQAAEAYRMMEDMLIGELDQRKLELLRQARPVMLEKYADISPPVSIERDLSKPSMLIYCGQGTRRWGYDSIDNGGIGGSETAVIRMAKEFNDLGWHVEVYGNPEQRQEGFHGGAHWYPYWRMDSRARYDTVVNWRGPWPDNVTPPYAETRYAWLHDVFNEDHWPKSAYKYYTGIIVLSESHRKSLSKDVPQEKVWISANGIDPSFFKPGDGELRDSSRMVYASCPARGLKHILGNWERIRGMVPDAKLDIFYGFNEVYRSLMRKSQPHQDLYNLFMKCKDLPGINYHGMVDQHTLGMAFSSAGVWAYPCSFPEISCITAMQAQVCGAVPVTTGYWALSETVQHGVVVGGPEDQIEDSEDLQEQWLANLIDVLKSPDRQEEIRSAMIEDSRSKFLWSEVAKQWDEKIRSDLKMNASPLAV